MENSFQTSFIPKKPIVAGGTTGTPVKNKTNIIMVVAVFIFVSISLAAGGLYFYKDYLTKNKEELSASLAKIRNSFDKETITELEMYDKRTSVVKEVLQKHIVLSPLFETINNLTLKNVQYTNFDHSLVKDVFSVRISGIARDYRSIALQANVFNTTKGKVFKDVIFSNLTKDKDNRVTFDVEFTVDPKLLSYSENIANMNTMTEDIPVINNMPITEPVDTEAPIVEGVNQVVNKDQQLPGINNIQ